MKKKFRETKVGKFLADKAPDILNVAGELLPDAGLLGAVGKMIDDSKLTPEDKAQAHAQLVELRRILTLASSRLVLSPPFSVL